jgi:hypothetical protein
METGIQSSFIPRDAGEAKLTQTTIGNGGGGFSELLLLLSIVFVVASGALAGGVFVYKQYMQTATVAKKEQLQRAKDAFDPSLIQQLTRLDDRMHAGSTILTHHIAPTVFLEALSQATLTTVAFNEMHLEDGDLQHINAKFSGVAQSVNSIALQSQLFSKNAVMTNPIFSNIGRQPDGVHFQLSLAVNPSAISYEKIIAPVAAQAAQQPQIQQQVQTSPFGGASGAQPEESQPEQ